MQLFDVTMCDSRIAVCILQDGGHVVLVAMPFNTKADDFTNALVRVDQLIPGRIVQGIPDTEAVLQEEVLASIPGHDLIPDAPHVPHLPLPAKVSEDDEGGVHPLH